MTALFLSLSLSSLSAEISGSSAATMLIFILPAAFYLRLVKSLPMHSPQKIGVSSSEHPKYLRLSIPDFFF